MSRFLTGNLGAFTDMLGFSEIGPALLAASDDGYNVIVGSTPAKPDLFTSYADHPRKLVHLGAHLQSTAAGKFQILEHIFDFYKAKLHLTDFRPESQERIAQRMISERIGAMAAISAGRVEDAIVAVRTLWASLPGAGYGQREVALDELEQAYLDAGGIISPS